MNRLKQRLLDRDQRHVPQALAGRVATEWRHGTPQTLSGAVATEWQHDVAPDFSPGNAGRINRVVAERRQDVFCRHSATARKSFVCFLGLKPEATSCRSSGTKLGWLHAVGCVKALGLIFLLLLNAVSPVVAQSKDEGWPLFRGDAGSSGVAKTTLPADPEVVWKYKVEDASFESTPVIVAYGDRPPMAIVGDLDGRLLALNLNDGQLLWEQDLGELGFTAAAACHEGKIFIGDFDGFFHCHDLDGKPLWKYEAGSEINGSANFYKNLVLFGAQDGALYALDRESGKLAWKYEADDQIQCSTTVAGNRAFLAGCDGKLHVIDLDSGKKVARVEIESPTGTTPATLGDHVYFGTQQGTFLAVDWKKAKIHWKREDPLGGTSIVASAAVNDQQVVYAARNRQVISLEPDSGKERWIAQMKSKVDASPVIVGDRVLVAATDGRLFLLDQKTGETVWQTQLNGSVIGSAAVAFERLVVATDRGLVYCLGKPLKNEK